MGIVGTICIIILSIAVLIMSISGSVWIVESIKLEKEEHFYKKLYEKEKDIAEGWRRMYERK